MGDTLAVMDLVYTGTVALGAALMLFLALAFIGALVIVVCLWGLTGALSRLASYGFVRRVGGGRAPTHWLAVGVRRLLGHPGAVVGARLEGELKSERQDRSALR
ncbi:hypothetical protein [Sinomonas soli]